MADASDVLVNRLLAWGVDTIFGLPGDGINGVFEALRKQKERIRFIHVRHEESAALMACAYAKFTGRLGFGDSQIEKRSYSQMLTIRCAKWYDGHRWRFGRHQ